MVVTVCMYMCVCVCDLWGFSAVDVSCCRQGLFETLGLQRTEGLI